MTATRSRPRPAAAPASSACKQGGIDLVVSDVKMPDLDGLDMLREIKAVTPVAARHHDHRVRIDRHRDPRREAGRVRLHHQAVRGRSADPVGARRRWPSARCAPRSRGCATRSSAATASGTSSASRRRCRRCSTLIRRLSRLGGVGAGHRRVGHGQGAGRARRSTSTARARRGRSSPSTARRSPTRCSRASCSATSAARSPTRAPIAPACSSRPTAARCSSTRSPSCRRRCRPSCCACCRRARSARWARRAAEKVDVRVVAATNKELEARLARRRVPRGPLLPPERHPHPPAGAARSRRGHPAAGRALPGARARRAPARSVAGFHEAAKKALLGLRLARQRARAGERGRARGGAGRGRR